MTLLKGSTYLALIISSTLLFMMQPWIYSWLVPHFGGGAHLWAAVLVFFQWGVALAYLCAAWGFSRFSARELFFVFIGLAGVAIWQLVDLLTPSPGVTSEVPSFGQVLGWLVTKVGAVTLLFAASPLLLQALWSKAGLQAPSRLYGWSNVICVVALVVYPVLVEPYLYLTTIGYGLLLGLVAWALALGLIVQRVNQCTYTPMRPFPAPPAYRLSDWGIVGFLGVALMTAGARDVAVDVAGIPFVGVLPLAAYLAAVALAFSERLELSRWVGGACATLALVWMMEVLKRGGEGGLAAELSGYTLAVLVLTYLLTAELKPSRLRSDVLLWHYVAMSVGGGLGGLSVSLIAPMLWTSPFEFHFAALGAILWLGWRSQSRRSRDSELRRVRIRTALVWLGITLFWSSGTFQLYTVMNEKSSWSMRSFLGRLSYEDVAVMVDETPAALRVLVHGRTFHGGVLVDEPAAPLGMTYYAREGGLGKVVRALREDGGNSSLRVGGIGLGLGGSTELLQSDDEVLFWEIDPLVAEVAESDLFDQLERARRRGVQVDVEVSDGRLGVRRLQENSLDLLILDAFSSDSIPSHLLTEEAFGVYWPALSESGLIAAHISNRHLDLLPVMVGAAKSSGAHFAYDYHEGDPSTGTFDASWVILWRGQGLDAQLRKAGIQALELDDLYSIVWQDEKKDLWSLIRWER